jgi:glycopeptide antibiotics resistance protein
MTWDHLVTILRRLFSPTPSAQITILRVVVVLLALALIATWRGWLKGLRGWLWTLLGLTVGGIIIATLAFRLGDRVPPGTGRSVNVQAFVGLRHAAGPHASRFESANFYGNVALYVPLGMILAWLLYGWLIGRVALAWVIGATLSTAVELTQSTMDRVVDINDIILNSSGAALGACLGCGVLVVSRAIKANGRARQRRSPSPLTI